MKIILLASMVALGIVLAFSPTGAALQSATDRLIAIDVLLEPDRTMFAMADVFNRRLRANYPAGYALDATHAPRVTLLQRFVRVSDLTAVTVAITNVLVVEPLTELHLTLGGLDYAKWGGVAVTTLVVTPTPELVRLQQNIADAVAPFSVSGGTSEAFVNTPPGSEVVRSVETFVPRASGANYRPHATVGMAEETFVKQLQAESFEPFTFTPNGLAIYQLGNFNTAAKKLWQSPAGNGPLASWRDGAAKQSIFDFVRRVTTDGGADFVPVPERIAVFDNDGTLWPEYPLPGQLAFVRDELQRRRRTEPALAANPMVHAAHTGNVATLLAGAHHDGLMRTLALTHAGMTTGEFQATVNRWLASTRHPTYGKPYDQVIYQPMLEVLRYLRAHDFKTFIVSGGGADFMRVWVERAYGIPPEQIVGSTARTTFEWRDGAPVLVKTSDSIVVDDKAGKPVGIHQFIGRRPIACFGNSDGDQAMLQYTTINNPRPSFGLIVHHTDGTREFAYDAAASWGTLDGALTEAKQRGWTVVSMKDEWKSIFPFDRP